MPTRNLGTLMNILSQATSMPVGTTFSGRYWLRNSRSYGRAKSRSGHCTTVSRISEAVKVRNNSARRNRCSIFCTGKIMKNWYIGMGNLIISWKIDRKLNAHIILNTYCFHYYCYIRRKQRNVIFTWRTSNVTVTLLPLLMLYQTKHRVTWYAWLVSNKWGYLLLYAYMFLYPSHRELYMFYSLFEYKNKRE